MSENKCCYWVQGMLIGGFIGVVAVLLFAPKSGKDTWEDMTLKAKELAAELKKFGAHLEKNKMAHDDLMDRLRKLEAQEEK